MMDREFVRYTVDDHVAVITIDRPPVNAYNLQTHREICETLQELAGVKGVRAVVLTAAGHEQGRPFGAGSDVKEFVPLTKETSLERAAKIREYMKYFSHFPVPIIAAVETVAIGAGLEYPMRSDIRVFSEKARVGMPEIKAGALGGGKSLLRLVPNGAARELVYLGDMIDAQEAYRIGLADHLVAAGQAREKALEIARKIASRSPIGIRLAKRQMIESEKILDHDEAYIIETELTAEYRAHPGSAEAARSVLEKRPPVFLDE